MRKRILSAALALALSLPIVLISKVNAATLSKRLSGENRYETGSKITIEGWTTSEYAVIASGEGFADALCAAPLAKKYNAPILLTGKSTLDSNAKNQLQRLSVKNVFIIGGSGAVSDNVDSEIKDMGIQTTRIYGKDRFETSVEVAKMLGDIKEIFITNGLGFADALSIAPVAAQKGVPILLTNKAYLPHKVKEFLLNENYEETHIIGGSGTVDNKVASELKMVTRLGGNNRYETNAAVLTHFASDFTYDKVYVASGQNYPDALSGSVLASLSKSPLILTGNSIDASVMSAIKSRHDKYNNVIILGGTGVVSERIANGVVNGYLTVSNPTAVKKEFEKMGFIFSSNTTAMYNKDGISIGLVDRGGFWQLAVKSWGDKEESLFFRAMSIVLGRDEAWSNLIYIDYALEMPNSVHTSPFVKAFVSNGDTLIVYVYNQ
ncbi:cell wall-binding repeat-containing protein [Clostridium sp. BSD9I1]|uniref:cell wall-binding repeat-containing protein n=1 Tax=Clostridium sp. BSD9I1 TaxID=2003589 RepID=UPI0016464184|nr:cell wall-binding repeat-containing protein [Clostridium sp. BSD9I1]